MKFFLIWKYVSDLQKKFEIRIKLYKTLRIM